MPDSAGLVKPSTTAEGNALGAFLEWLRDYSDWARDADAKRRAGAEWCSRNNVTPAGNIPPAKGTS